jgi:hypothetical protein
MALTGTLNDDELTRVAQDPIVSNMIGVMPLATRKTWLNNVAILMCQEPLKATPLPNQEDNGS